MPHCVGYDVESKLCEKLRSRLSGQNILTLTRIRLYFFHSTIRTFQKITPKFCRKENSTGDKIVGNKTK